MQKILENINTAAMVLGYPVLVVIVVLFVWLGTIIFRDVLKLVRRMQYERKRRYSEERDWDNIRASWLMEMDVEPEPEEEPFDQDYILTDEHFAVPAPRRHDTDVLPIQSNDLYNYQEERHERS